MVEKSCLAPSFNYVTILLLFYYQKGGWHPRPIHGQPNAVLSGTSSQKFAKKTKFHKVLVKRGVFPDRLLYNMGDVKSFMKK
jgi:hypothetical protein